jgi:hypothetical protein
VSNRYLIRTILLPYVAACLFIGNAVAGLPLYSYHDLSPMHSVQGVAHADMPPKESGLAFMVTPFYSHAAHAKDPNHDKVVLGDRLGRVNILGYLVGDAASPYTKKFDDPSFTDDEPGLTARKEVSQLHYVYGKLKQETDDTAKAWLADGIDTKNDLAGQYRNRVRHERLGLRGSLDYSFSSGLGIAVHAGVTEYSVAPGYTPNPELVSGVWKNKWADGGTSYENIVNDDLMLADAQALIGEQLSIDYTGLTDTTAEDTSIEMYWRKPYVMKDKEGDHVVTTIPYVSVGVTLPTAQKRKIGRLIDMPMGNDGFYGVTGTAEVNFDFPGMVQVGGGVKLTLFNDDDIGKQHVPSHKNQQGFYPWKASVTKRPGPLVTAYLTMKAEHFVDYLTCYMNYIFVSHDKDSITISSADKAKGFLADKLGRDGQYSGQMAHIGFQYDVTPTLQFGAAVQTVFAGYRVNNTVTIAGSMRFIF